MEIKTYIINFFNDFLMILSEMSPYLLLGFFFAGVLYAFMPQQKIEHYFSGKPLRSSFLASVFGIPLPLCSCGVIPTGTALYKNGASKGGAVSFLISTPQTGVDSILATFSLLGLPFAVVRPIAALISGVSGGLITSAFTSREGGEKAFQEQKEKQKNMVQKIIDVFRYGFVEFIQDISKWLVIGLLLAALISVLIPDEFFELLNLPPVLQMLMILVVSIPLYICATGSIPLAAILILKGISPGAAFVLLMAGPATNAATITMIGKVMGKRSLIAYLGTIIAGALTFGFIIDYALPAEWFTGIADQNLIHNHGQNLEWWQITSGVVLLAMILNGYIQKKFNTKQNIVESENINRMEVQTIQVEGMTCNHCKMNVETNLEKLSFIEKAEVNLNNKSVVIQGDNINLEEARATIASLGYKPV